MKKIFFFLLGLLSSCSLWAETVHVETPGTLKELLMDLEFTGTQLTLTGTLNAADLSFIHDGKGRMENVEELDISQIKVMPSDESYANGSVSYVAGDNFLPKAYFYHSTECYCDTTRTTDMLGRGHVTYKIHDNNLAGLFLDNASYKKVILPSWLKTIGKYMFQDSNIENCVFPEVYKEIEDGAFINSKISSITLPKECKSIGKLAFHGSKLKTIDLTYVSYLGKSVFAFSKLEGEINLGLIERVPAECFCSSNITSIKFSKNLKTIGVNMEYIGEDIVENDNFINKKFVVTGTLDKYSRDEVKQIIENNGGVTSESVSKKTDVVIVGRDAGSKYDKALKLGIEIWNEEKLDDMLK